MQNVANKGKGRKALPWFRFYTEALNDPKVQMLPPHLFKAWVNLLCVAGSNDGKLPSIDDIAFTLRLSVESAREAVDELILAGLLDMSHVTKIVSPHNWKERQFKSDTSAERTRKWRKNKKEKISTCDVTSDVAVTPSDTESDTESYRKRDETNFVKKTWSKLIDPNVKARAEGLGLNVGAEVDKVLAAKPANYTGYFITCCTNELQRKHSNLSHELIKQALGDTENPECYKLALASIVEGIA